MEEKTLIKSERYNFKKIVIVLLVVGLILGAILIVLEQYDDANFYDKIYKMYRRHSVDCDCSFCYMIQTYPTKSSYVYARFPVILKNFFLNSLIVVPITAVICGIIYYWLKSYELTVTDKKIYGKIAFNKAINININTITSVKTINFLNCISISTSAKKIHFFAIGNSNKIYMTINDLLNEQKGQEMTGDSTTTSNNDETEQLKKYKDLLDSDVITQEEFETKKKQISHLL